MAFPPPLLPLFAQFFSAASLWPNQILIEIFCLSALGHRIRFRFDTCFDPSQSPLLPLSPPPGTLLIQLWPPCSECRKLFKLFNKSSLCTRHKLCASSQVSSFFVFVSSSFVFSAVRVLRAMSFANYCSVHAPPAIKINFLSQTSPLSGQDVVKKGRNIVTNYTRLA